RFRKLRAAAVRSAAIVEIVPSAASVANGIKIAPSAHPVPSVSVRHLRTPSPWRAEPTLTTTRKKRASRSTMMRSWKRARRAKRAKRLCLQPRVLPHLRAVTVLPPDNSVAAAVVADVAVVPVVPLVAHLRAAVTAKPCSHPETSSGPHLCGPAIFLTWQIGAALSPSVRASSSNFGKETNCAGSATISLASLVAVRAPVPSAWQPLDALGVVARLCDNPRLCLAGLRLCSGALPLHPSTVSIDARRSQPARSFRARRRAPHHRP